MRKLRLREVTSLLQYHTVIILGGSEGITITFSKTIINFQRVTNAPRIIRSGISLKLKYFVFFKKIVFYGDFFTTVTQNL